ncbi:helix-turn-helix domain-containing protein [Streptomyces polyrhachis]|uniref:Helix-turn-helix domain-containing protein n=1 Tax=Streptomyces polyrhachis TaxID=1282885 RepID=A0ABW2GF97_9ACTN
MPGAGPPSEPQPQPQPAPQPDTDTDADPDPGPAAGIDPDLFPTQSLAAIVRPELPTLIDEIFEEIIRAVPEYAVLVEGPFGRMLRTGVERNLDSFADQVADPGRSTDEHDELFRRMGRFEALEGRDFEVLRTAVRVGVRVCLRRARIATERYGIPSETVALFADLLFSHIERMEALCRQGYQTAASEPDSRSEMQRSQLVRLLADSDASIDHPSVAEIAEAARWPLPALVTPVALTDGGVPDPAALDDDILLETGVEQPLLLVPGRPDDVRLARLRTALAGAPAAVGLTVVPGGCADSLRWARQLLAVAASGALAGDGEGGGPSPAAPDGLLRCEEHLTTLFVLSDPELAEQLARRELAPLDELPGRREQPLRETLNAWFRTRGTAQEIADLLDVHQYTVYYRLRSLRSLFGGQLDDRDRRFAIEVALHAAELLEGKSADPAADGGEVPGVAT